MSGYAVTKKSNYSNRKSQVPVLRRGKSLANTTNVKKAKSRSIVKANNQDANIPTLHKVSHVSVSNLLVQNNPLSYSPEYYQKALAELKMGLKMIGVFLFLVYIGWAAAMTTYATDSGGLIYNTGLIGGILMLVALIYAVFKRINGLRRLLASEVWYYLHIGCGAVGAYLVLLHSSFDLRSINASVGLVTTVVVIISGALGRYIYTLATISLHRQLVAVKDTEQTLFDLIHRHKLDSAFRIQERLSRFTLYCFNKPGSRLLYLTRWVSIAYLGVYIYLRSKRDLRKIAKNISKITNLTKKDIKILKRYQKKKLRQYILHTMRMGYTSLVEQVFRYWRVLHVPALYLLTLTAIVHVIGVHIY